MSRDVGGKAEEAKDEHRAEAAPHMPLLYPYIGQAHSTPSFIFPSPLQVRNLAHRQPKHLQTRNPPSSGTSPG